MKRQRVAIITGQLDVGGAERQLYFWLSHLDRNRFEPMVVTLNPSRGDYWEKPIEAVAVPLFREKHRHNRIARLANIFRALRSFRPQLIHGWNLFTSPYAGAVAKLVGAKGMGSLRDNLRIFNANRREALLTQYLVDGIVVNSRSAASELDSAGKCSRQNIYVVPNGVEPTTMDRTEARGQISKKYGLSDVGVWIGALGRLVPKKRFDLLLQLFASLLRRHPGIHALLVGDGPLWDDLHKKAAELGIFDHVTFIGEDPEARKWLSALDIFCFTSFDEGLPNVVMEAAAAGVPIVSWGTPFVEELFDHSKSSLLVEPGNLSQMEDAVDLLIREPKLREGFGAAGHRHIAQHYSIETFVRKMTAAYEDLIGIDSAAPAAGA